MPSTSSGPAGNEPGTSPAFDETSARLALESSTDCIKVLSLDGSLESMNEGGIGVMEIEDFGDFRGACWPDFWRGEENAKAVAALDQARAGGVGRFQGYSATAKGNVRYWDVTVSPVPGADGRPQKLLSVSRDVTAQKEEEDERERLLAELQAERARAAEANALLRQVTDSLPVRVAYVDRDLRYRFLNGEYARVFGRPIESAVGRPVAELVGDAAFDAARPLIERALAGEAVAETVEVEYPFGKLWVETGFAPVRDEGGEVVGTVVQAKDVTERIAAERALRDSEAHYRGLFESVDDGFCTFEMILDEAGRPVDYRFLEVNDAFSQLTGLSREAALGGRTIRELAPTHEQAWFDRYGDVARTGVPLRIEDEASALGRRYEIHAFRIGGVGSLTVGALFKDVTARHEHERALAVERARLDHTLHIAGVATFDWDVRGNAVRGNALFAEFFGVPNRPEGNSLGLYFESIHTDDRRLVEAAIARSLAAGDFYEAEYRVRGADGRERTVIARGDSTLGEEGRPLRLVGVILDITGRARAEEEARQREELFRTVFEQAPDDAIVVTDAERRIAAWNPAAERIMGWGAEEASGQAIDMIFTPEDRASGAMMGEAQGARAAGRALDERWHLRKGGSRFWGSGTMNALHHPNGSVRGYLKVFRDATERHEKARALAFMRGLTDAIIGLRDADEIVRTAERLLGEHLGVTRVLFAEGLPGGDDVEVREEWAPLGPSIVGRHRMSDFGPQVVADFQSGRTHVSRDAEREYRPGEGLESIRAIRAASGVSVPIHKEGRLVGLFVVHHVEPRDWTEDEIGLVRQVADRMSTELERARAVRSLSEANEALEARVEARTADLRETAAHLQRAVEEAEGFNYAISHDLRTPLRAISMTSSVLLEEAGHELSFGHRELLERQRRAAARLALLIDGLLQLSRLSRVSLNRQEVDMTHEARSVGDLEAACRIEVQKGMTDNGDPGLLHSVWQNLIGNACKFSPQGGTVSVGQEGDAFFVRDEGVGFDMRYAPKIFLPFERLVSDEAFPGTGIGLANVKRIVERHGGRVWCESEPGKGSTFWFTLGRKRSSGDHLTS